MSYTLIIDQAKQKVLEKLNYKKEETRKNELAQYLDKLNILGFYIELLPQIEPKFFVEKQGFSIKEALFLTRGEKQTRPTDEEIKKLQYDEETNILQLEFINLPFDNQDRNYHILILGPPNRGKTTFIFNIINYIFNVQYNSMYRVKKKQQVQPDYFDEYYIQISGKNYIFVDFRGIGDLKLDFLGADETGNTNLYVEILQYIKNNIHGKSTIAAIFYINSSSINRLSEDESYCLQRFFELIPKTIIKNDQFFLVLTYCTDNQPKMTIYQNSKSTPKYLSDLLIIADKIGQEQRFWYGINNKPLYEPIILLQEQKNQQEEQKNQEKEKKEQKDNQNDSLSMELQQLIKNIEADNCLKPQDDVNDGRELEKQDQNQEDKQNQNAENKQQVELGEGQLQKFQFNLMTNVIKEIILKVEKLSNQNDDQKIFQFFEKQLEYEKDILELLKIYQSKKSPEQIQKVEMKQFTTTYIVYEFKDLQEKEKIIIKKGSKLLFCNQCQLKCHLNCHMRYVDDKERMCRKFAKMSENNNGEKKKGENNKDENNKDETFQCQKCFKRDSTKKCKPSDHLLIGQGQEIPKKTLIALINYINYQQIKNNLPLNKKSKILQRLKQTAAIKAQLKYQNQIEKIKVNISHIRQQNEKGENSINMDLDIRAKYLEAMMDQLKNNNQNGDEFYQKLEEQKEIYHYFQESQEIKKSQPSDEQQQQKQQSQQQQVEQQQPQQQQPQQQQPQLNNINIPSLSFGNSSISQQQNSQNMSFRQQQQNNFQQNNEFNNNNERQQPDGHQFLQVSAIFNNPNDQQPLMTQN